MKFNISYPQNGAQKCIEIDDDKKCSLFYDKKLGAEVQADSLGEEFKGYIFKITGGHDKQGFAMKQGVAVKGRARLLMKKGSTGYRPKRTGEKKRKTVRGCIVGEDIRTLALRIVKVGDADIQDLTNKQVPRRLGPKRVTKLRRLFNLDKKNDGIQLVKQSAVRRTFTSASGKERQKAPKIQRLITDVRLRRKRIFKKEKKDRGVALKKDHEAYMKLLNEWRKKKQKKLEETQEKKADVKDDKKPKKEDKKTEKPVKQDAKKTKKETPAPEKSQKKGKNEKQKK